MSDRASEEPHALCVVVPYHDEARGMAATLHALATQTDRAFTLVLVDNASTDDGPAIAARFAAECAASPDGLPRVHLIQEPQKGTGAASDTGFRHAIAHGARWIARTDADCIPAPDWVRALRRALADDGLEFVAGKIRPRRDEGPLSWRRRAPPAG